MAGLNHNLEINHDTPSQTQMLATTLPTASGKPARRCMVRSQAAVGLSAGQPCCALPGSTLPYLPLAKWGRLFASPTPAPAMAGGRDVVLKFALELGFATVRGDSPCGSEKLPAQLGPFEVHVQYV